MNYTIMFPLLVKRISCSKIRPVFTRFSSASPAHNPDLKAPTFNVVDYLVNSFGLSPTKAARISKPIAHLKSPQNPDAVLRFLDHHGFAEPQINKLITVYPTLLCCPQKSLDTNLRALRDIGLSTSALTQVILSGPAALQRRSAAPRIKYWRDFFGGDEAALVKAFKNNRRLITHDISGVIVHKLSLLQSHGLSTPDVQRIVLVVRQFISSSAPAMEDLLKRTKELGFQPGSKMFVHGLGAMIRVSRGLLQEKMELIKSFGWSEQEFLCALRTMPGMVRLSENNLRTKMHFFIGEVKLQPSYIATFPGLLLYSLEKRLRPRHCVLQLLELKGLFGQKWSFYAAMLVSDTKFIEIYIVPHKEKISGLHEAYLAAFA